jgi:hypothetical protein
MIYIFVRIKKLKNMKNATLIIALLFALRTFAVDRIVEEFGIAPAFSSINAAVAAAQNGDRIIIKNRAGNIPWIENVTVDKSLEFLSFANNDFFIVQGNYTIQRIAGLQVSIVGMRNTSGNILSGSGVNTSKTAKVNILDSYFLIGDILLNNDVFDVIVAGCTFMEGRIFIPFGSLIGNDITYSSNNTIPVIITNSSGTSFQNDTCFVVGNRINQTGTGVTSNAYSINITNHGQICYIYNNYIRTRSRGINLLALPNVAQVSRIWNNTITGVSSTSVGSSVFTYGIYVETPQSNASVEIMNNAIIRGTLSGITRAISKSSTSTQVNVYFNHISPNFSGNVVGTFTFVDNNPVGEINIDTETGNIISADNAINGGNPAPQFFDLDLSPNDAGCWGGSYTHANFFPLHTGSARVYNVIYPFNVRVGTTMNVKAFSFDR